MRWNAVIEDTGDGRKNSSNKNESSFKRPKGGTLKSNDEVMGHTRLEELEPLTEGEMEGTEHQDCMTTVVTN